MVQVPQEIEEVEVPVAKQVQVQIQKVQMVDVPQVEYEDQATPTGLKPGLRAQVDGRVQRLDGTSLDSLSETWQLSRNIRNRTHASRMGYAFDVWPLPSS